MMKTLTAAAIALAAMAIGGATADAMNSNRARITWHVGYFDRTPFDARPGDTIIEHYPTNATGDFIIARCADTGAAVVWDHVVGFNAYACSGLDF